MQVTMFSVIMTIIWSTIIIMLVFSARVFFHMHVIYSPQALLVIYLLCILRMCCPFEFVWTVPISSFGIINPLHKAINDMIDSNIIPGILLIWLLGTLIGIIRLCIYYKKAINTINSLTFEKKYPIRCKALIFKSVEVLETNEVSQSISIGIKNKKIVIPANQYDERTKQLIICHEIEHHNNNDMLTKVLINILCTMFWWNPFVWLLQKDLEQVLELRCDKKVVCDMNRDERVEYLNVLLNEYRRTAQHKDINCAVAFEGIKKSNYMVERFEAIASYSLQNRILEKMLFLIIVVVTFFCSYMFILQSNYIVPQSELNTKHGYEVDTEKAIIYSYESDVYYLYTGEEKILINKSTYDELRNEGFRVEEMINEKTNQ